MIIELWNGLEKHNKELEDLVIKGEIEPEELKSEEVVAFIKGFLMGDYHGILIKAPHEFISETEMYLLTWDGEACDGGRMDRVDIHLLISIANDSFTDTLSAD